MKAMILAAGRGERMRPHTDHTPKPLLEVAGRALIVRHIERLSAAGIADIVINVSHLGHLIEAALGDGVRYGVNIAYSREDEALDVAGGIANALPLLGAAPFAVVSGDIYAEYDCAKLAAAVLRDGHLAHLVLIGARPFPAYDFALDAGSGMVIRCGAPQFTFAGIGVFHPAMFAHIASGTPAPLLPLLLLGIADRKVSGEVYTGAYANLTTAQDVAQLDRSLRG